MAVRQIFVAGLLILLTGCITTKSTPDRWAQLAESERAILVGTVTAELSEPPMTRYRLSYRNLDTKEEAYIDISTGLNLGFGKRIVAGDADLEVSGKSVGRFLEISLPAGRYEFYEVHSTFGGAYIDIDHRSRPFKIPFNVEAGVTYYFGELRAYPVIKKDFLGMSQLNGGYFVLRDNRKRDMSFWSKRHPEENADLVRNLNIDVGSASPLLRHTPMAPFDATIQQ
ncbi:MAG: hypothetical protein VW600_08535 [Ferrovibrio sp.]